MNFVWVLGGMAIIIHYLDYRTTYQGLRQYNHRLYEGNVLGRWMIQNIGLRPAILFTKVVGGLVPVGFMWLLAPNFVGGALLAINLGGVLAVVNNFKLIKEVKNGS